MATATQVDLGKPVIHAKATVAVRDSPSPSIMDEAIHFAALCRPALNDLNNHLAFFDPSHGYTAEEILALPLDKVRVSDELHGLPRRRSARHELAVAVAALLHPSHEGSLTALIRYEGDRVRLRGWALLQRKYDLLAATRRHGRPIPGVEAPSPIHAPVWTSRILGQGIWNPNKHPISLKGVRAVPMPVRVAEAETLAPFFAHLRRNGSYELDRDAEAEAAQLDGGLGEPFYGTQGVEFQKGVVYEDGRMDLCKMVVGPDHIGSLMDSLRPNDFVRHFLLGNNIVGPTGAHAIAAFINDEPNRMETWYLAGNCIDGAGFKLLVDAMVRSTSLTNVWMKRNPLRAGAAADVYRLITQTKSLRTLDLDQTELGDLGVTELFDMLAAYKGPDGSKLPLRNLYLNGSGIAVSGAKAIAKFLGSPHCAVSSVYMSTNPLGDDGVAALIAALPQAPQLTRLLLQSVGVSTQGAVAVCEALSGHPGIRTLDLGQAYATHDLGQAYNYIEDGAVPAIAQLFRSTSQLEHFSLGHCPITSTGLIELSAAVRESPSLLYYGATSVVADPARRTATFTPSGAAPFPDPASPSVLEIEAEKAIHEHLETNVRAKYGRKMTYAEFMAAEKRWLVNDRDVRYIDSVYRNRDAGMARRGQMTLVKEWDADDDTLERIQRAGDVSARPTPAVEVVVGA